MTSPFLGVYTAVYAYTPQGDQELVLEEGDLLYVLERSDDDWWKVKKKVNDSEDDEPVGLVPATYIEEVSDVFSLLPCSPRVFVRWGQTYKPLFEICN